MDDIPPPVTTRNFISTTLRPQLTTNVIRRAKLNTRDFLFPDEITTKPPKDIQFLDNNVLETVERSRGPQTFFLYQDRTIEASTINPSRNNKRVRFQERSDDQSKTEADQTGSASEINLHTYKDLSRYLTFS